MTKPLKTRKTFTRNNFAEHNYNYVNPSQTTHPPQINRQNHLFSQKSNFPNTSNFHDYPYRSQDQSENYPFSHLSRKKQQTSYYTSNYLSSDDDDYYQPDIFAPYTREYCAHKPRQNQASQKIKYRPQNLANTQSYQPLHIQNQPSTQSYQPAQSQTRSSCILINQRKCKMKYHYHIIYNNMK